MGTSALFGIVYSLFRSDAYSKLIKVHFWLHMIGFPILVIGMYIIIIGHGPIGGPLSGVGGLLVIIGAVLFSYYCFKVLKPNQVNNNTD